MCLRVGARQKGGSLGPRRERERQRDGVASDKDNKLRAKEDWGVGEAHVSVGASLLLPLGQGGHDWGRCVSDRVGHEEEGVTDAGGEGYGSSYLLRHPPFDFWAGCRPVLIKRTLSLRRKRE